MADAILPQAARDETAIGPNTEPDDARGVKAPAVTALRAHLLTTPGPGHVVK
jgi:hypothetical protein